MASPRREARTALQEKENQYTTSFQKAQVLQGP